MIRDRLGRLLSIVWPYIFESQGLRAVMADEPAPVLSCWNGIAILDPAPFYSPPHVRFRMARITENECSASECSLICNDYWEAGYGRILMVPRVKLAYDNVSIPTALSGDLLLNGLSLASVSSRSSTHHART